MRKLQFGAGQLPIDGWENHDMDVDIRRILPYQTAEIDFIFGDMVLEHVTHREAWSFISECNRILKVQGVLRLVIPDFLRIWRGRNEEWRRVNTGVTQCQPTWESNAMSVLFAHGHQALWTSDLLVAVMEANGFVATRKEMLESDHPELKNIEQHWKSVGMEVAMAESGCVEGVKI